MALLDKKEKEMAHGVIRKAMEDAGIVDGFYCGITLDGTDIGSYQVGNMKFPDYSNVERIQRLIGSVESLKFQMMLSAHIPPPPKDFP